MKTKGVKSFHLEWNNNLTQGYDQNGMVVMEPGIRTKSWRIVLENGKVIEGEKRIE